MQSLNNRTENSLINEISETEKSSQSSSHADSSEAVLEEPDFYPTIAYFVAFTESEDCNANKIFQVLHESETIAQVRQIASRSKKPNTNQIANDLFNVLKDHNNTAIENIVKKSNKFCFYKALIKTSDLEMDFWEVYRESDVLGIPLCISKRQSRLVVANRDEYAAILKNISRKLCQDGLVFDFVLSSVMCNLPARVSPPSDLENAIDMIQKAMFYFGNALYHGGVYGRPKEAKYTYVYMMQVDSYLHKLLASELLRDSILKHQREIEKYLSSHDCTIIPQIEFDFDLIEVCDGKCLKLSARKFIDCPLQDKDIEKKSSRMFTSYDSNTVSPDAKYFTESVHNSFQEEKKRAQFLNKFYQCLLAFRFPHKIRKLVVVGPKDSGKTTWASVFLGICPLRFVASMTKEKQFSAAMINDDTQIVLLDEWSEMQGGYMVTAVKHGEARTIINRCPFYIATNPVPKFGADDVNVKRRILVFETKSLPKTDTKVEDWIRRNAMKCIHWTISEIEEHYSEIEPEELWYENTATPDTEQQVDYANDTSAVFDLSKVVGLRETHLVEAITGEPEETSGENYGNDKSDFLHERFMQVAAHEVSEKIKRLPGKETRQQSLLSDMESEYESDNDPRSPLCCLQ